MKPQLRTLVGALSLAALLPSTALAQNIATEIVSGQRADPVVPRTIGTAAPAALLIKTLAEAKMAHLSALLPTNTFAQTFIEFDEDTEMLLLAVDEQPRGPGSISIEVEEKSMFDGWAPLEYLKVTITRRLAPAGTMGLPSAIRPFALVKVPKSNKLILPEVVDASFVPTPSVQAFTEIERLQSASPETGWGGGGMPQTEHVSTRIRIGGDVEIRRWRVPGPSTAPTSGTATPAELLALTRAIVQARFAEIPQDLQEPGASRFKFNVKGLPQGDREVSGALFGGGQFKSRLDPVNAAIDAIQSRIEIGPPNAGTFDTVSFSTTTTLPGADRTKVISINKSGNVTVSQIQPGGPTVQPAQGQASAADLTELRRLVKAARVASIPAHLNVVLPMHLLFKPFMLLVSSVQQQNDNKILGQYGYYGEYDARLRPLIAKVEAIGATVTNPVPLSLEITQSTTVPSTVLAGDELEIDLRGLRPSSATQVEVTTQLTPAFESLPPTWKLTINAVGTLSPNASGGPTERPFRRTVRVAIPDAVGAQLRVVFNEGLRDGSAYFVRTVDIMQGETVRGIVESRRVGGGRDAVWLVNGTKRIRVLPMNFGSTLLKFEGHEVVVRGQSAYSGNAIRAAKLLSPVRQSITGRVSVQNGVVHIGHPIQPMPPTIPFNPDPLVSFVAPWVSYKAFGPGAQVAKEAAGLRITADAWVFESQVPFDPADAYLIGINATVRADSHLTRRGRRVNQVKQGDAVFVTGLTRQGHFARVKPGTGRSGYIRLDKLDLGDGTFMIQPTTGNNAGLAGSLEDADGDDD